MESRSSTSAAIGRYIQIYNAERDPVFVELTTGELSWLLPNKESIHGVVYVSHLAATESNETDATDEVANNSYYEQVGPGTVSWALPLEEMSEAAVSIVERVQTSSRSQIEKECGISYNAAATFTQIAHLDEHLAQLDEDQKARSAEVSNDYDIQSVFSVASFDSSSNFRQQSREKQATSPRTQQISEVAVTLSEDEILEKMSSFAAEQHIIRLSDMKKAQSAVVKNPTVIKVRLPTSALTSLFIL